MTSTDFDTDLPPVAEKRRSPRRKTYMPAKIVYGNGVFSIDVTIKDHSETGAALRIPAGIQIPQDFFLIDIKKGDIHQASPVSVRGRDMVGVKFGQSFAPNEALGPDLEYLRRLRMSCVP